jgi:hypothetical protein
MKDKTPTIGLVSANSAQSKTVKEICSELAQQGISAIVKTKGETAPQEDNEQVRQLTGQPGQDLFFNGWKLLF